MANFKRKQLGGSDMFLGLGYAVPFSFFGVVIAFVVFSVALLTIVGIQELLKAQKFIW